ncbi:MAG: hypothetical protein IPO92_03420 [Saprospiraceae bacterium]|nr:hypothetical protein [Saprospiraceae bacterium]
MKGLNIIFVFLISSAISIYGQITGTVSTTESICISDGTVKITDADPTSEYALTGDNGQIPQLGPFTSMMGMVVFNTLPKGPYTITEFKSDNSQPTQGVTVPGNYEQNWIFDASVVFGPCSNGNPTVNITDFTILNALPGEQRGPYQYRISAKNSSLPLLVSDPPPFLPVTGFNIPYPAGMNGNYEVQALDACGNYKTINVYVPATAPGAGLDVSFTNFANCAGDAVYTATASGGTPNYVFTIIAPSTDQIGVTQTTSGTAAFNLTALGSYTIQVSDQCGGITTTTVTVKPYVAPDSYAWGASGMCLPLPNGTGTIGIYVEADGLGPYSATITNDCGQPVINVNNLALGTATYVENLVRPCNYVVTVMDACMRTVTYAVELIAPGNGILANYNYFNCPANGQTEIVSTIGVGYGPPYSPTSPFTFELYDALNNPVAGYPVTQSGSEIYPALPQGTYTYKITDACGATTLITTIDVPLYQLPTVVVDLNNPCFGAGQVVLIGTNNNPLNPTAYNYFILSGPSKVGEGPETDSDPNTGKFSSLQNGGTYTFRFNDGCKDVDITVTIPTYMQPTWEAAFGAICTGKSTADIEIVDLQPAGMIVGPYTWRITSEDSDIFTDPLPYPSAVGQTSPIFANLPPKNPANAVATYMIQGSDACKNSFMGSGKVGILPDQTLLLNMTSICADGHAMIRARVSTPLAGGTYVYYLDGIEVARSTNLFTFIMNAMPGNYTAQVFPDILGDPTCFTETPAVVVSASLMISCVVDQLPTCSSPDGGVVSVSVSNGPMPYTYMWTNGATTATVSGLTANTYTVTVSDGASCMSTCTVIVSPAQNCCNINAIAIQSLDCLDNGTPGLYTDNRLSVGILATNSNNALTTFNVTVNGGTTVSPGSGTYGVGSTFLLGPGTAGGGATFTLTLTDSTNALCTSTIDIVDPGTCNSNTPPDCPTPICGAATIQVYGN